AKSEQAHLVSTTCGSGRVRSEFKHFEFKAQSSKHQVQNDKIMIEENAIVDSDTATSDTRKWVYLFEEGSGQDKSLLGGKGAGLCEMTRAGLPVPPGLIVTTEACNAFFDNDKSFP